MKFTEGFEWNERRYGWHNRHLYALPYEKKGRNYAMRELMPLRNQNSPTTIYSISGTKLTVGRLQTLCKEVDWEVKIVRSKHTPF